MASKKTKPLSFSTTIRNPRRIPDFLRCILPYENSILTSDVIHGVIKNLIKEKIYKPTYIGTVKELDFIYKNPDETFNDVQLELIIDNSPQKHKEAGFEKGWDSRFDTWYKMIKEFGFIDYSMNEPITVTQTGHMFVDAWLEEPRNEKKIQNVFLNALMKYQASNPLRKNLSKNAPLPLLLRVIKKIDNDPDENSTGLARHELPIVICWQNDDADALYKYIKTIRKEMGFKCSEEYIYEKCLSILGSDNKKYLKMDKICREAVDEYIRKMRMSGVLSLRGNGRFLDINSYEKDTVDYIIDNYSSFKQFDDVSKYIEFMGTIDKEILIIDEKSKEDHSEIRKKTLQKYANQIPREMIIKELNKVCNRQESTHAVLRYINAPTRLEFLTSIALIQNFEGLDVNPNYSVDDEGLPTFTASGGLADIECFDSNYDSYFEVTLMKDRTNQVNNEILPISRHLQEAKKERREESFAVFIAPIIHQDTIEAAAWQKERNDVDIMTYDIKQFTECLQEFSRAEQLLKNNI